MSRQALEALARFRLEQTDEALETARMVLKVGFWREGINRAYYAMFYAVMALLSIRKQETSKHQGAIGLFDLQFVKTAEFTKDFSEWLHAAFNLRLRSDYYPFFQPTREQAEATLANAERFVLGVKEKVASLLSAPECQE